MAKDQHDHSKPAREPDDAVRATQERRARSESPHTPATVSVSIDLRGTDQDRIAGVISRILAAVAEAPSVTVAVHGPVGPAKPVSEVFDLRADEDDDPLAAFPAEHASPPSPVESLRPERPASAERRPTEIHEETKFEWHTQPAAGPLVRRMASDNGRQPATHARPRLRAAASGAWTSFSRGCQRVRDKGRGAAGAARERTRETVLRTGDRVARFGATLGRVAAQSVERVQGWGGRRMRGVMGAGLAALVLVVALTAMLPMLRIHTGRAKASAPLPAAIDRSRGEHRARALAEAANDRAATGAVSPSTPPVAGPGTAAVAALRPAQRDVEEGRNERRSVRRAVSQAVAAPRFVGGLRVWSTPRGASVAVNNRHVGTTPVRLKRLPVGTYAVQVDLDGFERWSRAVQVSSGSEVVVRPALRREYAPSDLVTSRVSR